MKKLKITALALALAMLVLPLGVLAAETQDHGADIIEIPVCDMEILPGTWNPLSEMTPEKEFLLEMTSNRLYRMEAGAVTPAMAAAMPADVTADYAGSFGIPAEAVRGYAFSIDLNERACWEDGTPITAGDWLFTVEKYLEHEKCYVNFPVDEGTAGEITSLADAGFATLAQAREAGNSHFYLDISRFWGLEGGWKALDDHTRLRDYAIPSGMDEFFVTPAYLYGKYLADGRAYDRWQPDLIGVSTGTAPVQKPGYFETGTYQITLILSRPTTATALALELWGMHPIRETLWSEAYATSCDDYSACGPYRVATVEPGLIELVINEKWYGGAEEAPELIRCKPMV